MASDRYEIRIYVATSKADRRLAGSFKVYSDAWDAAPVAEREKVVSEAAVDVITIGEAMDPETLVEYEVHALGAAEGGDHG